MRVATPRNPAWRHDVWAPRAQTVAACSAGARPQVRSGHRTPVELHSQMQQALVSAPQVCVWVEGAEDRVSDHLQRRARQGPPRRLPGTLPPHVVVGAPAAEQEERVQREEHEAADSEAGNLSSIGGGDGCKGISSIGAAAALDAAGQRKRVLASIAAEVETSLLGMAGLEASMAKAVQQQSQAGDVLIGLVPSSGSFSVGDSGAARVASRPPSWAPSRSERRCSTGSGNAGWSKRRPPSLLKQQHQSPPGIPCGARGRRTDRPLTGRQSPMRHSPLPFVVC